LSVPVSGWTRRRVSESARTGEQLRTGQDVEMIEFETQVNNKIGVHLRAAGEFVKVANKFASDIMVIKDGRKANGKSILGLASLAIERGAKIVVKISGRDEREARSAIERLIENNFNED
jgi:phosphocarrier protein HPr